MTGAACFLALCLQAAPVAGAALADVAAPAASVMVAPTYPPEAISRGLTGSVSVCFLVRVDGRVTNAEITRSSDPLFDAPALAAIGASTFRPALRDGVPAPARACRTFRFDLDEASDVAASP